MEPHVNLAFSMRSTSGGYAILLGAGASVAAGMPSAFDVQQDLIVRMAAAEGESGIGDPHAWYKGRFGHEATYDALLAALTTSPFERQALLRSFFEPDQSERERGVKQPTQGHQAIARLVDGGHVRIILTTNFDGLIETALRQAGIEPTVVAHRDDVAGLAPLHTLKCLVVHVHGYYLNATSMLNTPEELDAYDTATDALLDRIFDDYGLVIAGWSATWDPALRNALSRCSRHVFASYWTDPYPLPDVARDVLARRRATYVQTDSDTFFGEVADAVDALADTERRHPTSIAVEVASAKRSLSGTRQAISLHDTLRRESSRIASLPLRIGGPWDHEDVAAEHGRRLGLLESETELLLALIATTSYWGTAETDRWWMRDLDQLGTAVPVSGATALLNLARSPATMAIYAAGVAALAAERWSTLVRLLTEPQAENWHTGKTQAAAVLLSPGQVFDYLAPVERLHNHLNPVFTRHLALSPTAYVDAWERFEYLRAITQCDAGEGLDWGFMRKSGRFSASRPGPSGWIQQELDREGDTHPLLAAGFLNGSAERLNTAQRTIDEEFNRLSIQTRWTT
ncbi:SIR2 family protein [Streptomyces microflavus]|uniref:SIR2 family protein n=1 Tax=Streptomyces microflavus TaxID=1919 RepID=UPI0035D5A0B2